MRFGLANRGGEFSCSSRSGGSGVRVSARPDIFASEFPRRDHRVFDFAGANIAYFSYSSP